MSSVKVVCRIRPQNRKEIEMGLPDVTRAGSGSITLDGPETGNHTFNFDQVFGANSTQEEVYNLTAKPIVEGDCSLDQRCLRRVQRNCFRLWTDRQWQDPHDAGPRY